MRTRTPTDLTARSDAFGSASVDGYMQLNVNPGSMEAQSFEIDAEFNTDLTGTSNTDAGSGSGETARSVLSLTSTFLAEEIGGDVEWLDLNGGLFSESRRAAHLRCLKS